MNSFYYPYVGLGLLLVLGACNSQNRDEAKALFDTDVIPVQVQPLTPMDTASIVMASGTFTTDDETVLSFTNWGIIQRITVKEGEVFKRGQLLAALEPTEIDASVRQSQLALEKAERDYRRAKQLYLDSVATLEQLENAQTAHEVAKAEAERATY